MGVKDIKCLKMIVIEIGLMLDVVVLFSRQGEERVFMFPGTSCLGLSMYKELVWKIGSPPTAASAEL